MAGRSRGPYSRRAFVGLAGAGLVGTALGCSSPAAAPAAPAPAAGAPAAPAPAQVAPVAAAPAPLQYGTISKTAWDWPRYIALQKGYFERAGFQTDYILFRTPANGAQLLTAGGFDFAGINPETVIRSVNSGAPLAIIASDMNTAPYSLIARPEIRGFADFREDLPFVRPARADDRLDEDDHEGERAAGGRVRLCDGGRTAERMAALRSGAVAGGLIGQPQDFQLVADGYRRLGPLQRLDPDHPLSVHAGRIDWLQANPSRRWPACAPCATPCAGSTTLPTRTRRGAPVAGAGGRGPPGPPDLRPPRAPGQALERRPEHYPAVVQKSLDFLVEIGDLPAPTRPPSATSTAATSRRSTEAGSAPKAQRAGKYLAPTAGIGGPF